MKKLILLPLMAVVLCASTLGYVYYDAWTPHEWCSFSEGTHDYWQKIDGKHQPDGKHEVYNGHELRQGKFRTIILRSRRPNKDRGTNWIGLPNDYLYGWEILKAEWIGDVGDDLDPHKQRT